MALRIAGHLGLVQRFSARASANAHVRFHTAEHVSQRQPSKRTSCQCSKSGQDHTAPGSRGVVTSVQVEVPLER
jgi:hypothetical protein